MKVYIFRISIDGVKKIIALPASSVGKAEERLKSRFYGMRINEWFLITDESGIIEI